MKKKINEEIEKMKLLSNYDNNLTLNENIQLMSEATLAQDLRLILKDFGETIMSDIKKTGKVIMTNNKQIVNSLDDALRDWKYLNNESKITILQTILTDLSKSGSEDLIDMSNRIREVVIRKIVSDVDILKGKKRDEIISIIKKNGWDNETAVGVANEILGVENKNIKTAKGNATNVTSANVIPKTGTVKTGNKFRKELKNVDINKLTPKDIGKFERLLSNDKDLIGIIRPILNIYSKTLINFFRNNEVVIENMLSKLLFSAESIKNGGVIDLENLKAITTDIFSIKPVKSDWKFVYNDLKDKLSEYKDANGIKVFEDREISLLIKELEKNNPFIYTPKYNHKNFFINFWLNSVDAKVIRAVDKDGKKIDIPNRIANIVTRTVARITTGHIRLPKEYLEFIYESGPLKGLAEIICVMEFVGLVVGPGIYALIVMAYVIVRHLGAMVGLGEESPDYDDILQKLRDAYFSKLENIFTEYSGEYSAKSILVGLMPFRSIAQSLRNDGNLILQNKTSIQNVFYSRREQFKIIESKSYEEFNKIYPKKVTEETYNKLKKIFYTQILKTPSTDTPTSTSAPQSTATKTDFINYLENKFPNTTYTENDIIQDNNIFGVEGADRKIYYWTYNNGKFSDKETTTKPQPTTAPTPQPTQSKAATQPTISGKDAVKDFFSKKK